MPTGFPIDPNLVALTHRVFVTIICLATVAYNARQEALKRAVPTPLVNNDLAEQADPPAIDQQNDDTTPPPPPPLPPAHPAVSPADVPESEHAWYADGVFLRCRNCARFANNSNLVTLARVRATPCSKDKRSTASREWAPGGQLAVRRLELIRTQFLSGALKGHILDWNLSTTSEGTFTCRKCKRVWPFGRKDALLKPGLRACPADTPPARNAPPPTRPRLPTDRAEDGHTTIAQQQTLFAAFARAKPRTERESAPSAPSDPRPLSLQTSHADQALLDLADAPPPPARSRRRNDTADSAVT